MEKVVKITEQQKVFCAEYIIDLNATQAAIRADYSKKTARSKGCQLLTKVNIQKEIQKLKAERSERLQIRADFVVAELAKVAFSNIKRFLDIENDEVYFKDFKDIPDEHAAAIESIKVMKKAIKDDVEIQTIQFKLHSKLNALEQLGRHLGIYEKDNEQLRPIETAKPLTIEEMKKRITEAEEAGTGIDQRSIEGSNGDSA